MGYNFLSNLESPFEHSVHNHGYGDFGVGADSTSHIESVSSQMKGLIKKIYYIIHKANFATFIREIEFRINIKNLSRKEKWGEFLDILNYVRDTVGTNIYNYNYIN